jgi:hypothetical protein
MLTQQELELKTLAVARIRQHVLPAQAPRTIWAGQGSGERCSLCDRIIEKIELQYELDAPVTGGNGIVRLHLRYHALWQLEMARLSERTGSESA